MPSTRDIRRRIKSVKNTAQITRAMQMVAAAKMRKAQDQARLTQENMRRVADGLAPVKSIEDITVSDEPDVLLAQAADIMADGVAADARRNAPEMAQQASTISH